MNRPETSPLLSRREDAATERLEIAAAEMSGRLARLLDRAVPGEATAQSREFLLAMAAANDDPAARWLPPEDAQPIDRLATAFGLTPLEVDLIVLAGLPEEHEGFAGILRTLHPASEPRPTAGLAAQLFGRDPSDRRELRATLTTGSAVRNGVLKLGGDGPLFDRSLLLADSLWCALHGLDTWPESIQARGEAPIDAGIGSWLEGQLTRPARVALEQAEPINILITAETEEVAQHRAVALAAASGVESVTLVLKEEATAELQQLVGVHAIARGVVPIVRPLATTGPAVAEAPTFDQLPGPVIVCARFGGMVARGARAVIEVRAERLTPTARQELWRGTVPELAGDAPALAARYTIEPATAASAAADARAIANLEHRPLCLEDVAQGVRTRAGLATSSGVRMIRPTATWDQLVLPERRLAQLRESIERLMNQARVLDQWGFLPGRPGARGVRMLFAGASGTGKTFAAEVIAGTLGVDLLLVDISRVVSKWIGETEKNLAEVFDVAERAQAVLLFDEADALFGKRTEVSDAHDRYANLETAFLLSRLERFEGLAILATNLRQNIDPAFTRRLEFVLDFEEPGLPERLALWRAHLPPGAPLAGDVDLRELASLYAVVGGFVRNAAVSAGFYAAAEGSPITRTHLVRAIRREYEKSGRAFPGYPAGMAAF